jgi:hypothetical protein
VNFGSGCGLPFSKSLDATNARNCEGFHFEMQNLTELLRDVIRGDLEPSSTTRWPDHVGPVKTVATSMPMSLVATLIDFRLVGC